MFNFFSREERYEMKKQIDDLERALNFEQRERRSDEERLRLKEALDSQTKRLDAVEARFKAEAEATKAALAEEYAKMAVEMASRCAADFGISVGTVMDKVLGCLKEFKPVAQNVSVIPTTTEVVTGCKCGK